MKHVIASSEGAWQSRGCGVYSEQQNRGCFVAIAPRNDKKERASLNIYIASLALTLTEFDGRVEMEFTDILRIEERNKIEKRSGTNEENREY